MRGKEGPFHRARCYPLIGLMLLFLLGACARFGDEMPAFGKVTSDKSEEKKGSDAASNDSGDLEKRIL